MKKILAFLLAVSMILAMAACAAAPAQTTTETAQTEQTEQTSQTSKKDTIYDLPFFGDRGSYIIGCHKPCSKHQTTTTEFCCHVLNVEESNSIYKSTEDSDEKCKCHNICTRDTKINDSFEDQDDCSDHDCDNGCLTDGSGNISDQHVHAVHTVKCCISCFDISTDRCQWCCTGYAVIYEACHSSCEGNKKETSCSKCRVHEVLSKSSKKLLNYDNCKYTSYDFKTNI